MIRVIAFSLCLLSSPAFSQNEVVPGIMGKRNLVGIQYNMVPLPGHVPHGPTPNAFASSFAPFIIRNNNVIGLTFERVLKRNGSLRVGLNRFTSYLPTHSPYSEHYSMGSFDSESGTPVSYFIQENENIRTVNTQLSVGYRFYEGLAPVSFYFEAGFTGINYRTESHTFMINETDETIDFAPSGMTWNGYLAMGYSKPITERIIFNIDLTISIRTFGGMIEFQDIIFLNDYTDPEEYLKDVARYHSLTSVWLGFRTSITYAF
ncbi:MAG: hypothetical protein JJU02_14365 [Cryomorphaceae bacterium]|nr:hypothetical protein [Cryomorphaceae bacterium]